MFYQPKKNLECCALGLMWCLWKARDAHCFEGQELSRAKLKYLLLKLLSEWTSWSPMFSITRFMDFQDSLSPS